MPSRRKCGTLSVMVTISTPALLTDHYELTMLQGALRSGAAHRRSVFEVFTRRLPEGRRYGVTAGTGRVLEAALAFRFDEAQLAFLDRAGVVDDATVRWLADYRFHGSISGYPEGECYFPGSPILTVEGSFAECVVLETVILSILNHDSAIAAAASRMVSAAAGRPCIEMGSRRTHEHAAVDSARAAYLAGFASTSNLRGRVPLRRADRRHRGARVHAAARQRARRLPDAGGDARQGHHAAGGHLRRGRGGAGRGGGGRARPRRGAAGLRRPAVDGAPGAQAARRARRPQHQDRRHQRPGRVRDRGAGRRPGGRATASAPSW